MWARLLGLGIAGWTHGLGVLIYPMLFMLFNAGVFAVTVCSYWIARGLGYKPDLKDDVLVTVLALIITAPGVYGILAMALGLLFGIRIWPVPSPSG
jgi:hypothetical protein